MSVMTDMIPPPPFYDRNIFWGLLSMAVGALLAAAGFLLPPTEIAKWLLVLGGILFFIASLIAIRELKSVVMRAASAATSFALITVGLLFVWGLRTVRSPEKTGSLSEKATALVPPPTLPLPQPNEKQPAPSVQRQIVVQRPYDLSGVRRTQFIKLLQQNEPRQTIRIGCLYWSESACVGAGQFLIALSEAGWNMDSGRVFRLDSLIPKAGVSIVSRTDPENTNLPPQPPHLGRWHRMSES